MSYDSNTQATLDALATVFFAAATVWLVLAVLYSLSVLLFIRMRARGQLGSIYDAEFGRVYLCGGGNNNNNSTAQDGEQQQQRGSSFFCRLYIPMGFLFRRFVMLSRTDGERERHMNQVIRIMTPAERRRAMESLLLTCSPTSAGSNSSLSTTTTNSSTSSSTAVNKDRHVCKDPACSAAARHQQQPRPSSAVNTTIDTEDQDGCSIDSPIADESQDDEEMGSSSRRYRKTAPATAATGGSLDVEEEGPSCSICLAEFDHDVEAAALEAGVAADYNVLVSKTCTHQFHVDCIMSWLERGNNIECPCCRVPMVSNEDEVWATVKAQRKELQRRKKKQKKNKDTGSIRSMVQDLLARFSSFFSSSDSDDSQRPKRESEDDNGENNMDATEQSEAVSMSDMPVQEAASPSPATPPIPPPPPPPRLQSSSPRHSARSSQQRRSSPDLSSTGTTEPPRHNNTVSARFTSQQGRSSELSSVRLSV